MRDRPTRRRIRRSAFTLIETVVSLAVVAVAVVMLAALVGNEPRTLRRLEAHRQAWEVMGEALETLRTVPGAPVSGAIDATQFLDGTPAAETFALSLEATPGDRPGLWALRLTASYRVTGRAYERSIESLLWRPLP